MSNTLRTERTDTVDQAIQESLLLRREQRLAETPEPDFPASGTEMVAARLARARAAQMDQWRLERGLQS